MSFFLSKLTAKLKFICNFEIVFCDVLVYVDYNVGFGREFPTISFLCLGICIVVLRYEHYPMWFNLCVQEVLIYMLEHVLHRAHFNFKVMRHLCERYPQLINLKLVVDIKLIIISN